ncbi:MAG: DUF423 domain-containing protein [Polyangia bacterium]
MSDAPDSASAARLERDRTRLAALGALLGGLGVVLGAFGAHALRARISPELLEVYRTGVFYQLVHALALLSLAGLCDRLRRPRLIVTLFGAGVLIFSGSLYALAITGTRAWGAVTPFGGACLIAGWGVVLCSLLFRRA